MKAGRILGVTIALAGMALLWLLFQQASLPPTPERSVGPQSDTAPSPAYVKPAPTQAPPFQREAATTALTPLNVWLNGWIVDQEGFPVPKASVYVYQSEHGAARVLADDAGMFRFLGLPQEVFRITARAEGYNEAVLEGIPHDSQELVVVMSPLSRVAGRVVDAKLGRPIAEFDVAYFDQVPSDESYRQRMARMGSDTWQSISDSAGSFVVQDVASEKTVAVGVRARGYAPTYAELDPIAPGKTSSHVTLALEPAAAVEGRVVDASKQPVEGVRIHLGDDRRKPVLDVTDGQGRFSLSDLAPTSIQLTISHPDFPDQTVEVSPSIPPVFVQIVLARGGRIEGRVFLADQPLPGVRVVAGALGRSGFLDETTSDASGHFLFAGIPPGEAEVLADIGPMEGAGEIPSRLQRRVLVAEGDVAPVDFRFPEVTSALEGVITIRGRAPASATVRGTVVGAAGDCFFSAALDEDGFYRASGLVSGEAWIQVVATTLSASERRRNLVIEIPEGALIRHDISFEGTGVLTGRVVGMNEGETGVVMVLPAVVDVNTSDLQSLLDLQSNQIADSRVASDGAFRLEGLDPGDYRLLAIVFHPDLEDGAGLMNGLAFATAQVVLNGDETERVTLSLKR